MFVLNIIIKLITTHYELWSANNRPIFKEFRLKIILSIFQWFAVKSCNEFFLFTYYLKNDVYAIV